MVSNENSPLAMLGMIYAVDVRLDFVQKQPEPGPTTFRVRHDNAVSVANSGGKSFVTRPTQAEQPEFAPY